MKGGKTKSGLSLVIMGNINIFMNDTPMQDLINIINSFSSSGTISLSTRITKDSATSINVLQTYPRMALCVMCYLVVRDQLTILFSTPTLPKQHICNSVAHISRKTNADTM